MLARFCPLLTTYPPSVEIYEGIPLLRENLHTADFSSTTYLPCLVNVVCECSITHAVHSVKFDDFHLFFLMWNVHYYRVKSTSPLANF